MTEQEIKGIEEDTMFIPMFEDAEDLTTIKTNLVILNSKVSVMKATIVKLLWFLLMMGMANLVVGVIAAC